MCFSIVRDILKAISVFFIFTMVSNVFGQVKQNRLSKLVIYAAPHGEKLNEMFKVTVNDRSLPIYNFKVNPQNPALREQAYHDLNKATGLFTLAAFGYFDLKGSAIVKVSSTKPIRSAKVLPEASGIKIKLDNGVLSLNIRQTGNYVIEINGNQIESLQLFVNPIAQPIFRPNEHTIYFGPGIHYVSNLDIGDNTTVYVAGGAVVRARPIAGEEFTIDPATGLKHYKPVFKLHGRNIRFTGRGIVDGTECPLQSRDLLEITGSDVTIDGIIFRDPPIWTMPVRNSSHVFINNVKILGYRPNSDGIDVCNSQDVRINNSYIRSNDDLIVVKTNAGAGVSENIVVDGCVLWNQLAHALSIGAEVMRPVRNITFRNCDIIHDKGIEWTLRVYNADSATVSNIVFENIRIFETDKLASIWVGKNQWSKSRSLGNVNNVVFKNITVKSGKSYVQLDGADNNHQVMNIVFNNIRIENRLLKQSEVRGNEYTDRISVVR